MKLILFSVVGCLFIAESIGNPNDIDTLSKKWLEYKKNKNSISVKLTYSSIVTILILIKLLGSNFDDSDESNVKDIWQNEDPDELTELDDGLYGF